MFEGLNDITPPRFFQHWQVESVQSLLVARFTFQPPISLLVSAPTPNNQCLSASMATKLVLHIPNVAECMFYRWFSSELHWMLMDSRWSMVECSNTTSHCNSLLWLAMALNHLLISFMGHYNLTLTVYYYCCVLFRQI
jgi:hypothetical protein